MINKTVAKSTVLRGSRKYVEIEGANYRLEYVKRKLREKKIEGITTKNCKVLLQLLEDLEKGRYISKHSKKGARSPKRLVKLYYIMLTLTRWIKGKTLTEITEKEIHKVFDALNEDQFRKKNGEKYKDKRDFKKDFATFWHWHMIKTFKKKGIRLDDITEYLTTPKESKPKFVFFTLEQLKENILQHTNNEDIKAILMILFDTGSRPSEFYNLRLKDVSFSDSDKKYMVDIPDEVAKTYGRKIKLWITSTIFMRYLERNNFNEDDLIFIGKKNYIKKFLYGLNQKKEIKEITKKYEKNLTLYDFRHSSACYYLDRYKNAKDMKYRYGWAKESEIEYYTKFLGKQDILTEEDLLSPEDRSRLEEETTKLKEENQGIKDTLHNMRRELDLIKAAQRGESALKEESIKSSEYIKDLS